MLLLRRPGGATTRAAVIIPRRAEASRKGSRLRTERVRENASVTLTFTRSSVGGPEPSLKGIGRRRAGRELLTLPLASASFPRSRLTVWSGRFTGVSGQFGPASARGRRSEPPRGAKARMRAAAEPPERVRGRWRKPLMIRSPAGAPSRWKFIPACPVLLIALAAGAQNAKAQAPAAPPAPP